MGELCGIDLHSSGIQQREERSGTPLGECALCLMCQQLQRVDSDEGDAIAEAEALGKRSSDTQSRVATRACTHSDSREGSPFVTTECLEQLVDHGGKGCGVPTFGGLSFA